MIGATVNRNHRTFFATHRIGLTIHGLGFFSWYAGLFFLFGGGGGEVGGGGNRIIFSFCLIGQNLSQILDLSFLYIYIYIYIYILRTSCKHGLFKQN